MNMKSTLVSCCVLLGCHSIWLSPCFADFATPFVEIHNKPGDVSVSHAYVATLGPDIDSRFLVMVMNDQMQPVVLWATAKPGVLKESLLGREISIKAVIVKAGSSTTKPEIEILQAEPLKSGVEPVGAEKRPTDLASIAGEIKSITVYDLEGLSGPKYSKQDLEKAFQASLDTKLFQEIAPEAKFGDEWVVWKGSRLAVARLNDGTEKLLALSYYGGFFKILGEDGFFYFEGEAREKWEQAFTKAIVQDDFIPKRIQRNTRQEEGKP